MKCPHCRVDFHPNEEVVVLGADAAGGWQLIKTLCSRCLKFSFTLSTGEPQYHSGGAYGGIKKVTKSSLVWPKGSTRPPCPLVVSAPIKEDYGESCVVLPDSPKASAALSRRCLQSLLREAAKVKHGDLYDEIQEVLDRGQLPSHISEALDAVRVIGNFAAHPIKSKSTGEIVPVELGEAEWNLDVLEALFDYYYVQPAIVRAKKEALNKKLVDAGKAPLE